ncbi:thaumatin family protein [Streptomyces sp. MI02-7b]|uniref:thaumatin family protein n=1 Tax=Streptomyces sp. MI02-7b TaxID=462941 RepID=UPI0029B5C932|nr:thaumatin family protein [Streptomyces sp. MI02-7b]MDX3072750.1 thaumatin family protein [Streptomyces sp. MI02-7b]
MARRSRHGARSPRTRRWTFAAAAVAVAVLAVYGALTQFGADDGRPATLAVTAGRDTAPAEPPSAAATRTTPAASPSASPSASHRPSGSPGPSARTSKRPSHGAKATPEAPGSQAAAPAGSRAITLVNRTQETIWAVVTDSPAYPDGRRLAPGQSTSLTVGNKWGGRIWGRTGCATTAASACRTGDCTSVCTGPNPPTTLGEFTFDAYAGLDFYDVSMVDGSNLPMYINISHTTSSDPVSASGCYKGTCTSPVVCPSAMQATSGGRVIGCKPPCAAFGGDVYCCRGAWAGRAKCVPSKWPVDYTRVFKKAAPYAYSYAFDDSATMSCKGACYYRVTFGTTG